MASGFDVFVHWVLPCKAIFACDLVQCGYSVMSIRVKLGLNRGLKPQVLVAYRMAVASILIAPFARLRKEVDTRRLHSQSVVGTLVNIGGATPLTFAHRGAIFVARKSRLTFAVERANTAIWSIYLDVRLLATFYGREYSQETAYYILGLLVKERGPVFLCASNPLSMVMVAIVGSFIFKEKLYVGRNANVAGPTGPRMSLF
ncbi:WAT1-related protein At5g13670-like [Populus alba]|uniref:WAT1-related protein At5g13670-like n=1 Tax=Populus alba TaxID=43335 RepID=UPI003CC77E83